MAEALREVPPYFKTKLRTWVRWQQAFGAVNASLGGTSVVCSVLIGANTAKPFMDAPWAMTLSAAAALATFLVSILNAKQYNIAFEQAARELEAAIAIYRVDDSIALRTLADAEVRGLALLNRTRPDKS